MPPRKYSRGDRAALILLGQGKCYWRGCTEPLLKKVDGRYKIALQIAHIRTDEEKHERYVRGITPERVDDFTNLMFLCKPHHDVVDEEGAEERFTIKLLEKWKEERESGRYEQLQGLREVTEDKLIELISKAQQERDQEFKTVLDRLETTDREAAALLRELRDELSAVARSGSIVNLDAADMLNSAAMRLVGLEENSSRLMAAAHYLSNLEGQAAAIQSAADAVNNAAARLEDVRIR